MNNPLLAAAAPDALPAFDRIEPQHAEPALQTVIDEKRRSWNNCW